MRRMIRNLLLLLILVSLTPGLAETGRGWVYPHIGPGVEGLGYGHGRLKDFQGECITLKENFLIIKLDKFGDRHTFWLNQNTRFTPSFSGLRVGSKVRVQCDAYFRLRKVEVVPYHVWLQRNP